MNLLIISGDTSSVDRYISELDEKQFKSFKKNISCGKAVVKIIGDFSRDDLEKHPANGVDLQLLEYDLHETITDPENRDNILYKPKSAKRFMVAEEYDQYVTKQVNKEVEMMNCFSNNSSINEGSSYDIEEDN